MHSFRFLERAQERRRIDPTLRDSSLSIDRRTTNVRVQPHGSEPGPLRVVSRSPFPLEASNVALAKEHERLSDLHEPGQDRDMPRRE